MQKIGFKNIRARFNDQTRGKYQKKLIQIYFILFKVKFKLPINYFNDNNCR